MYMNLHNWWFKSCGSNICLIEFKTKQLVAIYICSNITQY